MEEDSAVQHCDTIKRFVPNLPTVTSQDLLHFQTLFNSDQDVRQGTVKTLKSSPEESHAVVTTLNGLLSEIARDWSLVVVQQVFVYPSDLRMTRLTDRLKLYHATWDKVHRFCTGVGPTKFGASSPSSMSPSLSIKDLGTDALFSLQDDVQRPSDADALSAKRRGSLMLCQRRRIMHLEKTLDEYKRDAEQLKRKKAAILNGTNNRSSSKQAYRSSSKSSSSSGKGGKASMSYSTKANRSVGTAGVGKKAALSTNKASKGKAFVGTVKSTPPTPCVDSGFIKKDGKKRPPHSSLLSDGSLRNISSPSKKMKGLEKGMPASLEALSSAASDIHCRGNTFSGFSTSPTKAAPKRNTTSAIGVAGTGGIHLPVSNCQQSSTRKFSVVSKMKQEEV